MKENIQVSDYENQLNTLKMQRETFQGLNTLLVGIQKLQYNKKHFSTD